MPTVHSNEELKIPSTLPNVSLPRKAPKHWIYQKDELDQFQSADIIKSFDDLCSKSAPAGYQCYKTNDWIIFYNIAFHDKSGFPFVKQAIKIDRQMHVQLQLCGNSVPLPAWFVQGRNAQLTRQSMLHNFPLYLNTFTKTENKIVIEMDTLQHYSPKGRPPYSSDLVRFALLLRYTSGPAYSLMLQTLPLPSFSLLRKLKQGNLDSLKAIKYMLDTEMISKDVTVMVDEMYLQKSVQYVGDDYVGSHKYGNLYKGMVVFMIQKLKQSIPVVIKACPEVTIKGEWLANEVDDCIQQLSQQSFNVRAVVTDSHSCNVSAFSKLKKSYNSVDSFFIKHPERKTKTYLFFDNVHLLKNIRNNLLNNRKFVFPSFSFSVDQTSIGCVGGYIAWADLNTVYEKGQSLSANLKKAHSLSCKALNPFNYKQSVSLALAIFSDTNIAAIKSYMPDIEDAASFLTLVNVWWTTVNSKKRFCSNMLGNTLVRGDGKIHFWFAFANWLDCWKSSARLLCFSKQTFDALICTLRAQACLCQDLLEEGCMINGGRFLVSLWEVSHSENALLCHSLLKERINFWNEDLSINTDSTEEENFIQVLLSQECNVDCKVLCFHLIVLKWYLLLQDTSQKNLKSVFLATLVAITLWKALLIALIFYIFLVAD